MFFLCLDVDGTILGRFNLVDVDVDVDVEVDDAMAVVGYRVAERAAGRGVATAAVRELCHIVAADLGLRRLRAATSHANVASQRVLINAGFALAGPADPADIGGNQGSWYERDVAV